MDEARGFSEVKNRLEEIAEAVGDADLPLDDALELFEEAVALGMQASDLLEEGALAEAAADAEEKASAFGPASGADDAVAGSEA